jgi:hypothetical protein
MDPSTQTSPYSCTLVGDELAERIDAWQRILRRATDRRVDGRRAVASYPKDAPLLEQIRELIEAERTCCSFLEFRVEEHAGQIALELRLPEETPAPMNALILDLMRD